MLFLKTVLLDNKCTNGFINRDRIRIIAKILIEAKKGLTKTQFVHRYNLNWQQLNVYLDFLVMNNLLSRKLYFEGKEKFVTTPNGNFFVSEFRQLQLLLE